MKINDYYERKRNLIEIVVGPDGIINVINHSKVRKKILSRLKALYVLDFLLCLSIFELFNFDLWRFLNEAEPMPIIAKTVSFLALSAVIFMIHLIHKLDYGTWV